MRFSEQVRQQQRAVDEFREAIEVIETQPKYEPQSNEPLAFLKEQMVVAADESDRAAKLVQAKSALAHSEQALAKMLAEWEAKQAAGVDAMAKVDAIVKRFNDASSKLQALAQQLKQVAAEAETPLREAEKVPEMHRYLQGTDLIGSFPIATNHGNALRISATAVEGSSRSTSPFAA